MPSSTSSVSSSSPSYASVLASQSGSISSSQTSITRSSSTSSLTSCGSSTSSSSFSPKSYLTVHDLYMRYAPLKFLTKSTTQVSLPRVLPRMTLKDLYLKFSPKQSPKQAAQNEELTKITTAPPSSPPPQPNPSSQNANNAEEEASAKTLVSTVDKQGRDVTRAGMKSLSDKPSPTYRRWCSFSPRWRHRTLTSLSLAQIGYKHTHTYGDPDEISCDVCQSSWMCWDQNETTVGAQAMHERSCSFYKPDPADKWA